MVPSATIEISPAAQLTRGGSSAATAPTAAFAGTEASQDTLTALHMSRGVLRQDKLGQAPVVEP